MADLLQAVVRTTVLAAAAIACAAPAQAQFSHRLHLAKKLDCAVCHATAWASTTPATNLLPNARVCLGCHTGEAGKGPKLASQPAIKKPHSPGVAKFSHQLHVKMGAAVAAAITRAIDNKTYLSDPGETRKQLNTEHVCTGCHRGLETSDAVSAAAYPRMADCLTCHNKVDPPFSCTKCHTEEQRLKPADHTADWVDVHSAGKVKDKTACAVCHGRGFTCLGCH